MVSSVSVMFLFLMHLCGVMKYLVGSMCISGQYGLYALCVWQALFQVVYLLMRAIGCSGISLRMEGNREVENRYRLGFGIGNPSVSTCFVPFFSFFLHVYDFVHHQLCIHRMFSVISFHSEL